MKNTLAIIIGIAALGFGGVIIWKAVSEKPVAAPPQQVDPQDPPQETDPPKEITFEEALNSIKADELKKNLYYLASDELEGRMSGKKGNVVAAEWIKQQYESFGLKTEYDKFNIRRLNSGPKNERGDDFTRNVYGWLEGNDPAVKDEIVVVGAHMDHIGYGPSMSRSPRRREIHNGADDNASGTVSIMAVARAFGMLKGKNKRTIVFQSYSAEEMGLIGSRHYCNSPTFPKNNPTIKKHIAMINLDMIGFLGKGVYFAGFSSGDSSPDIGRIINSLNSKYTFAKGITSRGSSGSDHASFYNKRVPICFLHTGGHPYYHTPDDTPDRINYDGVERISKYTFELAWRIVQGEDTPRFNHAIFKEMPYRHDHGHPEVPFHDHNHEE